ncbi:MAG TPA: VanW family protein [Nocardioides sp.]|uniref:VanW family protein n=1 Tax=Nocardioides sp. TaxID=35761 RepID=UPI002CD52230|nr:VanW family protein [Nocardioides sp.]HQR25618.1 VanW family protein [Nocardioides sp.]
MSEGPEPEREAEGGRVVLLLLLGLVVLFGGAYVAAYLVGDARVPRGTTVAGVEVGGQTHEEAVATLRTALAERVGEPIAVTLDGRPASVDPVEAGLTVDYGASVDAAGASRSWSPARLWDYYTGGDALPPVVTLDGDAMTRALDGLTQEAGRPARDGAVSLVGTTVRVRAPLTGEGVDPETAPEDLRTAYLVQDSPVPLALVPLVPEIDEQDVQQAVREFANPAMSGPVTLVFGRSPVTLAPRDFSAALALRPVDGRLVPTVDAERLDRLVGRRISGRGAPVDATVALVDGKPQVVPAKPGVTYRTTDVTDAFLDLVARESDQRRMRVPATVAEPEFSTADARRLRIKEKVSTFTTYFPYAEYRNTNIGRAAELVNGSVLKPGDTFSLNDTVGERTRANGFTEGFIISNGIFKEDLGGGVSQMATTTFNAMFFAGLEDVEHKPHSFYIDRYPVGREATVAWGAVDLRFRNDTPYGVLIEARVTPSTPSAQGVVTVSMWSTKYWDITTRTGERYNLTPPATRVLHTEDCYPNTGYGGFDIDIWRYFRRHGSSELVRTEKMHTHYIPSDTVICR